MYTLPEAAVGQVGGTEAKNRGRVSLPRVYPQAAGASGSENCIQICPPRVLWEGSPQIAWRRSQTQSSARSVCQAVPWVPIPVQIFARAVCEDHDGHSSSKTEPSLVVINTKCADCCYYTTRETKLYNYTRVTPDTKLGFLRHCAEGISDFIMKKKSETHCYAHTKMPDLMRLIVLVPPWVHMSMVTFVHMDAATWARVPSHAHYVLSFLELLCSDFISLSEAKPSVKSSALSHLFLVLFLGRFRKFTQTYSLPHIAQNLRKEFIVPKINTYHLHLLFFFLNLVCDSVIRRVGADYIYMYMYLAGFTF